MCVFYSIYNFFVFNAVRHQCFNDYCKNQSRKSRHGMQTFTVPSGDAYSEKNNHVSVHNVDLSSAIGTLHVLCNCYIFVQIITRKIEDFSRYKLFVLYHSTFFLEIYNTLRKYDGEVSSDLRYYLHYG